MPAFRVVDEHLLSPVLVYSSSNGVFQNELELIVEDGLTKEQVGNKLIIKGETFDSDLTVSLGEGRSFGRYASGEVIPAQGKTFAEIIRMAIVEPIAPTVSLASSTAIAFNQTNISNVVDFSHTINSLSANAVSASLEWRRGSAGSWNTLSTSLSGSGSYTHTITDSSFNTESFNYRYIVTDSVDATATASLSITPASYESPTISLTVSASEKTSPETDLKREKGNIASVLTGTVTRRSSLVDLISYTLQYSVNGGSWTDVGSAVSSGPGTFSISSTDHNDSSLKSSASIGYRVKVMDAYQQHLASSGVTGGNKTVSFLNLIFYGSTASSVLTSTSARDLTSKLFTDGSNPFDLETGSTHRRFTVALPSPSEITLVNDVDALNSDITDVYSTVQSGFDEKVYTYATDNASLVLTIPTLVRDTEITQVAAGNNFVLALDVNGRVHAWGSNDEGQLNVPVAAQSGVTKITAGIGFAYVLKSDGTVVGWGNSDSNRFDYTGLTGITDLFSGWFETLFINSSGAVIRRGSSTGVSPAFNISTWTSGVTGVAVGRYNMIAVKSGAAVVTGHSNHNALVVPEGLTSGVTSVYANGGTTLWAKKGTSYYGWGKADSGEMSELHAKIQAGDLGTVTSTYTAGSNGSALMIINDPGGVIAGFIPTQGYQLGVRMTDGRVFITGLGNLPDDTLPDEIIDNTSKVAIGGEIVISLGPNNDRRFFIDDAGGTPTLYNVYTMTNAIPYSENHRHRVTRG